MSSRLSLKGLCESGLWKVGNKVSFSYNERSYEGFINKTEATGQPMFVYFPPDEPNNPITGVDPSSWMKKVIFHVTGETPPSSFPASKHLLYDDKSMGAWGLLLKSSPSPSPSSSSSSSSSVSLSSKITSSTVSRQL